MKRIFAILVLALSFASNAEAKSPVAVYRGSWHSQSTGHQGPMRLRLRQLPSGDYNARFMGRFALVIPFTYRATMHSVSDGMGGTRLQATKRLPIFGEFQTVADVTPCQVDARYCADQDTGDFEMSRVR